jgi:hypothetical protein
MSLSLNPLCVKIAMNFYFIFNGSMSSSSKSEGSSAYGFSDYYAWDSPKGFFTGWLLGSNLFIGCIGY